MDQLRTCSGCGATNSTENSFCLSCGARLDNQTYGMPFQSPPTSSTQPKDLGISGEHPPIGNFGLLPLRKLGLRRDSWVDILLGAGYQAVEVQKFFIAEMLKHQLPHVTLMRGELVTGSTNGVRRQYYILQGNSDLLITVSISSFGRDLFLTLDLFARRLINWINLGLVALGSFFLAVLTGFALRLVNSSYNGVAALLSLLVWPIIGGIVLALLGRLFQNNPWAFLLRDSDKFAVYDITASMLVAHQALKVALNAVGIDTSKLREMKAWKG
jgi:hypothetical protein